MAAKTLLLSLVRLVAAIGAFGSARPAQMKRSQTTLRGLFCLTTVCSLGWAFYATTSWAHPTLPIVFAVAWSALCLGYLCMRLGAPPVVVKHPLGAVAAIGILLMFTALATGLPTATLLIMICVRGAL
jgi:hypothetical protein